MKIAGQEAAHPAQPQPGVLAVFGSGGGAACRGPPRLSFERRAGTRLRRERIPLAAPSRLLPRRAGKAASARPRGCPEDVGRPAWRSDGLQVGPREGRTINSPG